MPLARGGRPVRGAFTGTASRPVPSGAGLELSPAPPATADAGVVGSAGSLSTYRRADGSQGRRLGPPGAVRSLACSPTPWPRPFRATPAFRADRRGCRARRSLGLGAPVRPRERRLRFERDRLSGVTRRPVVGSAQWGIERATLARTRCRLRSHDASSSALRHSAALACSLPPAAPRIAAHPHRRRCPRRRRVPRRRARHRHRRLLGRSRRPRPRGRASARRSPG